MPFGVTPSDVLSEFAGMMNQKRQFSTMRVGFLVTILSVESSTFVAAPQMSAGSARKLFETGCVVSWIRLRLQTTSSTVRSLPLWNLTPLRIVTIVVFGSTIFQLVASSGSALPVLSYFTSVSYIA